MTNANFAIVIKREEKKYFSVNKIHSFRKLFSFYFKEYPTRKSVLKRDDFGIVNIVKEATPIAQDNEISSKKIPPVMDKIVQQTFVSPAKIDFHKLDEDLHKQKTITATEQLVEQTIQTLDDIRK